EDLVVDDRLGYGEKLRPGKDEIILGKERYTRKPASVPDPAPAKWAGLIGEYGPDHCGLTVLEKDGKLHALIEWFFLDPLEKLAKEGYGLLVFDGYRPWSVTKVFWEATPPAQRIFVADPSQGSRHNRGCAVDLTLYDRKTGAPVEMTGGYDAMSDLSYPDYLG